MKGMVLAAGGGTRLRPMTDYVRKPLLPIYDKPMLYYPLVTLMQAGIRQIVVVCTPQDHDALVEVMGDGSAWGIECQFVQQKDPKGPVDAVECGHTIIQDNAFSLIFGDNIFLCDQTSSLLSKAGDDERGSTVFAKQVPDPSRFGVVAFDQKSHAVLSIEEKPSQPKSSYAAVGLYYFDDTAFSRMANIQIGRSGEREIVDLLVSYLNDQQLSCETMSEASIWLDAGLCDTLYQAATTIKTQQNQNNALIGSPELTAYQQGWISESQLAKLAERCRKNHYGQYLLAKLSQFDLN